MAGETPHYNGPLQSDRVQSDRQLVDRPTHRAKKTNRSRSGGGDARSYVSGNALSKRVSKLPMGNRHGWVNYAPRYQGEQTSQETKILTPNVNEKRTRGQKPKPSGPSASSGSKVVTRAIHRRRRASIRTLIQTPSRTPSQTSSRRRRMYRTDVIEPTIITGWTLVQLTKFRSGFRLAGINITRTKPRPARHEKA